MSLFYFLRVSICSPLWYLKYSGYSLVDLLLKIQCVSKDLFGNDEKEHSEKKVIFLYNWGLQIFKCEYAKSC